MLESRLVVVQNFEIYICRYFVIHEMGHAKLYQCTKFKVPSFTHSKFREGAQNVNITSRDHYRAPFSPQMTKECVY